MSNEASVHPTEAGCTGHEARAMAGTGGMDPKGTDWTFSALGMYPGENVELDVDGDVNLCGFGGAGAMTKPAIYGAPAGDPIRRDVQKNVADKHRYRYSGMLC